MRLSAIETLFEHIAVGIDTQQRHGLDCLAPHVRAMGEAMIEQDWARLDAARIELAALRAALVRYGPDAEFPYGCDAIDHVAEKLVAARAEVRRLEGLQCD